MPKTCPKCDATMEPLTDTARASSVRCTGEECGHVVQKRKRGKKANKPGVQELKAARADFVQRVAALSTEDEALEDAPKGAQIDIDATLAEFEAFILEARTLT